MTTSHNSVFTNHPSIQSYNLRYRKRNKTKYKPDFNLTLLRSTRCHIKGGFERNKMETGTVTSTVYGRPEIVNSYLILKIIFLRYGGEFNIGPVPRQW